MKVLLLGSWAESLINFRGPLIRDMLAKGHDVVACAPDIEPDIKERLEKIGAIVHETPMARTGLNPIKDYRYFRVLRTILQEHKPDLVLSYTIKPNIWGSFSSHREKIPVVAMVTGLGYAFTEGDGMRRKLIRFVASRLYRAATDKNEIVIFQNADDQSDFIDAGCLRDVDKARQINGSGVDMEHYARAPLPQKPAFLMISRLLQNKGVREYCNAAALVKKLHPNVNFRLVGYLEEGPDGITQKELNNWVAAGIDYLGELKDVRPALNQCSVYVLPSYREGTPRSVLEAMAVGRAIITSDAPGCRETVIDGENGYLVPVRDVSSVAAKMQELIENPSLVSTMGENSFLARKKYDVRIVNQSMFQLLGL